MTIAPTLRRYALDEAADVLNARTEKARREARSALHAYCRSLDVLAGEAALSSGIASGVGIGTFDRVALNEVRRYLGESNADRLGFTEEALTAKLSEPPGRISP